MPSTAQKAALARAAARLPVRDRNLLRQHGRYGVSAVMDFLKVDREKADAELERVKAKLAPLVQQELRGPPETTMNGSSGLRPPEHGPRSLGRPLLRSGGEITGSTPARKRKPAKYKPKSCLGCGETFTPAGARQTRCEGCGGPPAVTTRVDPSVRHQAPPESPPSPTVEDAALSVAGVEEMPEPLTPPASRNGKPTAARRKRPPGSTEGLPAEYVTLRDELTAIQMRLHSFGGRLDRLIEEYTDPNRQNGGSSDGNST